MLHFDDIIKFEEFHFDNILLDEKSYKNILINGVSYKTLTDAKPLRAMFEKIHVFVKDYNRTKYLVLFGHKINGIVFDRLRYLIRGCVT